jgi:hypothetical protein
MSAVASRRKQIVTTKTSNFLSLLREVRQTSLTTIARKLSNFSTRLESSTSTMKYLAVIAGQPGGGICMTLHQDFSNNLHYIVPGESLCGNSGWMKFLMNRK